MNQHFVVINIASIAAVTAAPGEYLGYAALKAASSTPCRPRAQGRDRRRDQRLGLQTDAYQRPV